MIQAIACDLDGTLMDSTGRIDSQDVEGLRAAAALGLPLALITGRPSRCLADVRHVTSLFHRVYACNGAERLDSRGNRIQMTPLPLDRASGVISSARAMFPGCAFAVEFGLLFGFEAEYSHWPATDNDPNAITGNIESVLTHGHDIAKLLLKVPGVKARDVVEALVNLGLDVSVTHSNLHDSEGPVEIAHQTSTKGDALQDFARDFAVSLAHTAVFGDRANDVAMLNIAGHPVAVRANGESELSQFEQVEESGATGVGGWLLERLPNSRAFAPTAGKT